MKFKKFINESDDLKVQKKSIGEKVKGDKNSEFYCNNIKIATLRERKDYVKARPTDRIRTKLAIVHEFSWDMDGLRKLFGPDGTEITAGIVSSFGRSKDFYNSYGQGKYQTSWMIKDLNDYAERNEIPMSFK